MVWRSVFCLSYKPSLFLLSKQTLTRAKTHSHFYLCSVIRCEDNHKNYSEHKKENSRHPSTKAEPLLIPKGSLYMVFYLYLYSSPLCPFNALRKGTDPLQNPLQQVYVELPCRTLIELEGTSLLKRVQKGKHKGLGFLRIICRTQETCCAEKL